MLDEVTHAVIFLPQVRVENLAEVIAELEVRHALALCNRLVHEPHGYRGRAVVRLNDALAFRYGRKRQEHVACCLRRRRHERIKADNEFHRAIDGLHPALGLRRRAGEQVVSSIETHFDRIRIIRLHGTQR